MSKNKWIISLLTEEYYNTELNDDDTGDGLLNIYNRGEILDVRMNNKRIMVPIGTRSYMFGVDGSIERGFVHHESDSVWVLVRADDGNYLSISYVFE